MATEARGLGRRFATETKQAVKSTEFWAYVLLLVALFIAGAVTQGDAAEGTVDELPASRVWLYAIILTVGYLISRGLSKSGSHEPYTDEPAGTPLGERMRAAGEQLRS